MKLYLPYTLAALLAIGPVFAQDNPDTEVSTVTEVAQQESAQPNNFLDTCYKHRYRIAQAILTVVGFGYVLYSIYNKSKAKTIPSNIVDPNKMSSKELVAFADQMTKGMGLPKKSEFTTPSTDTVSDAAKSNVLSAQANAEVSSSAGSLEQSDTTVVVTNPQSTNVNPNSEPTIMTTLTMLRDAVLPWLQAKKAELANDWNAIEPISLEKLAHYVKPLNDQGK